MRDGAKRETSPALGGVLVGVIVLLAFVYALGDGNAFANLISSLLDRAGDIL